MKESTKQGEFGFTESVEFFSTRGQVYQAAINHFGRMFPHLNARQAIASRLGMSYQMLSAVLIDEKGLSSAKQDEFFHSTMFPIGYDYLKQLTFPEPKEIKK